MLLPAGFPGSILLQFVVEKLTHSMMWIVDAFSSLPGNTLSFRFDFTTMLLSYGALFFFFIYYEKRYPRWLFTSLLLLLLILVRKIFYELCA
jgi:competence protein ComEC